MIQKIRITLWDTSNILIFNRIDDYEKKSGITMTTYYNVFFFDLVAVFGCMCMLDVI